MKILISHSWADKTAAKNIAQTFRNEVDVWLDLEQLYPGQHIQQTIDQAIGQMGMVVVLWSANAKGSDGVAAEITSAKRQSVQIVPCLMDDTSLDNTVLEGIHSIDFRDEKIGIGRLRMALMRRMGAALGVEDAEALQDLKQFEGSLNYVNDYRNAKGISGSDSLEWGVESLGNTNTAYDSVKRYRDNVGNLLELMKSTMARIQESGNDPVRLSAIRDELARHPQRDTDPVRQLIAFVDGKLDSLDIDTTAPDDSETSFEQVIQQMTRKIRSASREPLTSVRANLSAAYFPAAATQGIDALVYYIESCPATLTEFAVLASSVHSRSLQAVASQLFEYLVNPNELLPDGARGIVGFLDDAWLINNTVFHLIRAQILNGQAFSVNWNQIVAGDTVALHVLPPPVKNALDNMLAQYLTLIGNEVHSYQPATNLGTGYVDYGSASGGAAEPQTIDDVFYTIGGKGYWS